MEKFIVETICIAAWLQQTRSIFKVIAQYSTSGLASGCLEHLFKVNFANL